MESSKASVAGVCWAFDVYSFFSKMMKNIFILTGESESGRRKMLCILLYFVFLIFTLFFPFAQGFVFF